MDAENSAPDFGAITAQEQQLWAAGDFNVLARGLMPMAEATVETADPRSGQRVLDVACGSGNAALVAARRYCDVVGVDYVPALIACARQRAGAEGLQAEFVVADAQALPFSAESFDCVLSVLGVMFAADQQQAALELLRVCRPGGTIVLASWMPTSFGGSLLGALTKYAPPPAGLKPRTRWGTDAGLHELFGAVAASIDTSQKTFRQYYRSAEHALDVFSEYFGPIARTLGASDRTTQAALRADVRAVLERHRRPGTADLVLECEYLEAIIRR